MPTIDSIVSGSLIVFGGLGLFACQPQEIQPPSSTINISNPSPTIKTTKLAVHQAFQSISAQLKQQTKIPVLLPTFIPESDNPLLAALVENINSSEYKVMLAFDPQCNGGTACYLGSVSGNLVDGNLLPSGTKVSLWQISSRAILSMLAVALIVLTRLFPGLRQAIYIRLPLKEVN